ncbi:nostrin-like [Sinocyclocheilus rhinocerous]|uniref:Osteoclast-stimulating factor 1 n=1 Tax=Sinocyclocheilus rhinocerous TaxID=307959 RepID=A0A673FLB9_9TELE|nr:PREDICTED: nostrin-like [Sinocyclocheilus rhinocerous]
MKDPLSSCTYNLLYQDLKRISKNGEFFCKELLAVFQQRSELEINYSKGLQKIAGKLLKVSKEMCDNSTYRAWSFISDEMYASADAHRILANALNQDAIQEIRQILDEHGKRKRPLDNAVEKSGKLVLTNWSEQIKLKKKLIGLTREHEALFSFVEKNKQICTEKEKQKMLNRLTKSAELQARVDEEYFNTNMEGHHIRLKLENTLKTCYQIVQELEKQRIETLSNTLDKYSLFMTVYAQTVVHSHKQIEQAVRKVDVEKDIQSLVEDVSATADESKAEFLMADYFEEEGKTVMRKDRRKDAIRTKLQRLEDCITKSKSDREGLEKMVKVYTEQPNFSNQKNLEETEQLLDEAILKLDLLEATHCKLTHSLAEIEGKPKSRHRFSDSITKWKEKDCEHNVVQLSRPVRIKKTPFRSRQSMRSAVIKKSALTNQSPDTTSEEPSTETTDVMHNNTDEQQSGPVNGSMSESEEDKGSEFHSVGRCKALYSFTSEREDELNINEGDELDIFQKDDTGWWFGELNGQRGHFPSTYVEELPVFTEMKSSEA